MIELHWDENISGVARTDHMFPGFGKVVLIAQSSSHAALLTAVLFPFISGHEPEVMQREMLAPAYRLPFTRASTSLRSAKQVLQAFIDRIAEVAPMDAPVDWPIPETPTGLVIGETILCLKCGLVSHNPNDVDQRFCGHCNIFH